MAVLPSPLTPWTGAPLRVIFVAEKPLEGELSLIAPDGTVAAKSRDHLDGPPYSWFVEVASPAASSQLAGDVCARAAEQTTRSAAPAVISKRAAAKSRRAGIK